MEKCKVITFQHLFSWNYVWVWALFVCKTSGWEVGGWGEVRWGALYSGGEKNGDRNLEWVPVWINCQHLKQMYLHFHHLMITEVTGALQALVLVLNEKKCCCRAYCDFNQCHRWFSEFGILLELLHMHWHLYMCVQDVLGVYTFPTFQMWKKNHNYFLI